MTYKKHGIYQRNLQILPKQLRKEIVRIEKQLDKIDRSSKKGRRKYKEMFSLLEDKKQKADTRCPQWRKEDPCLKTTTSKT